MPEETSGEFGREITIPCAVHGVPEPNITWFRDGIPLSETPNLRYSVGGNSGGGIAGTTADATTTGQKERNYDLHINFLKLEDSGMLQCSSSNQAGDLVGYTWLRVKSKYSSLNNVAV